MPGRQSRRLAAILAADIAGCSAHRGILANAFEELGRNAEAIETLTEAVRREPSYPSKRTAVAANVCSWPKLTCCRYTAMLVLTRSGGNPERNLAAQQAP